MDHSSAVLWIEACILAVAVIGNGLTMAYFAGRSTKAVETLSEQVKTDRETTRKEQDQQWSKINETAEQVSYLKGRQAINGAAKGASH